jgi:hypothetical protein
LTLPTIACAPSATWTCWTIIFCSPFERYSFKADTCAANVLASLLKAFWALSCCTTSSTRHRCIVNGGHLSPEHRLNLIARLDPLDDCEHEIRPAFVRDRTLRSDIDELLDEPLQKVAVRRTDGLQRCLVIDIDGASRDFQARPGSRCPVGFNRLHVVRLFRAR